jgi:peptidoglycan-associated lipoprotein
MMGDTMKVSLGKTVLVAALGVLTLSASGCGMKWLQSDGDQTASATREGGRSGQSDGDQTPGATREGGWNGQGVNPNFPGMQGSASNELSGFSQNPNDEYLARGGGIASPSPTTGGNRHHAELTREERAAMEAGLEDVFFGYDAWTLSDPAREALNHNAQWLKEHPGAVLKVEGHCDERGTADYNMILGDKRSKSARMYLTELGVNPKQVGIVSYGKERPFCTEHDESCYQQNRRGHVLLKKK